MNITEQINKLRQENPVTMDRANHCTAVLNEYYNKKITLDELKASMKMLMLDDIKKDKCGRSQLSLAKQRLEIDVADLRGEIRNLTSKDNLRFNHLSEELKKKLEKLSRYTNLLHGIEQRNAELNTELEEPKQIENPVYHKKYYWEEEY